MNKDEYFYKDLAEYFPKDLLTEEEIKYAIQLNKEYGSPRTIKYIKECRSDFGLKSSRIYYDLYIGNNK